MDARIDGLPSLCMAYCVRRWLVLEYVVDAMDQAWQRINPCRKAIGNQWTQGLMRCQAWSMAYCVSVVG